VRPGHGAKGDIKEEVHRCHAPTKCWNYIRKERLLCDFHWTKVPDDMRRSFFATHTPTDACVSYAPSPASRAIVSHLTLVDREERRRAAIVELPEIQRVVADTGPDGPAVGVHYWIGGRYGFVPPPPWQGGGKCWNCGATPISIYPPFCAACARSHYGDRIFEPHALASRGIMIQRRRAAPAARR